MQGMELKDLFEIYGIILVFMSVFSFFWDLLDKCTRLFQVIYLSF